MILLNFSHPIADHQKTQVKTLTGQPLDRIIDIPTQLREDGEIGLQLSALVDQAKLSKQAWQTEPILINPPGFAPAAACLLAELHGRMGHFPTMLVIRPRPNSAVSIFDVTEIINLQALRNRARVRRM